MILIISEPGHVADVIRHAAEHIHEPLRAASVADPDLFTHALGCRTIAYVAEPRLLEPRGSSDPEHVRAVVRAAHAPGVERVVVVVPYGDRGEDELRPLRKDGVPYTILRVQPLLDELADATNLHAARSVWLPRGKTVELTLRTTLATAVIDAITRDDLCGSTVDVPSERMEIADALARAAALAGAALRVHVSSPSVSFAMRKLSRWIGLEPPELEALCDRLGAERAGGAAAA